jgi:hypothetical protein
MLTSILGARLSWHFANGCVFEPAIVGPDIVDYMLKEGPHGTACHPALLLPAGGSGSRDHGVVGGKWRARPHTWYLESQTVHRFAALPAWLAEDMTV